MYRIRSPNDVLYGLSLVGVAALGFWLTADLRQGTALRMGPGYVPRLTCWVLIAIGAVIAVRGLLLSGDRLEAWALRPLIAVLAAVAFFLFAVEHLGLPITIVSVVLIASAGDTDTRWTQAAVLGLVLAAFCSLVFVMALGLPISLVPRALSS